MPKKDNKKRGPLENFESVGKAALAVGAGAAFLMNGKGLKPLTEGFSVAKKVLGSVSDDFSKTAFKNKDFKFLQTSTEKAKMMIKENTPEKIKLRLGHKDSLLSSIAQGLRVREGLDDVTKKSFDSKNIKRLQSELIGKYADNNERTASDIKNLVENSYRGINNAFYKITEIAEDGSKITKEVINEEFVEKQLRNSTFNPEEQNEMMQTILKAHKDKKKDLKEFKLSNSEFKETIANKFFDYDTLKEAYGSSDNPKFFDKLLENNRLTVKELVENKDKFDNYKIDINKDFEIDIIDFLENKMKEKSDFGSLYVDNLIRKNADNEIYSLGQIKDFKDKALDEFASTLLGKILKTRELTTPNNAPVMRQFLMGDNVRELSKLEGNKSSVIGNEYFSILGNIYKYEDNSLNKIKDSDAYKMIQGRHGAEEHLMRRFFGDSDRLSKTEKRGFFDIGNATSPSMFKKFKSVFKKFSDENWERNILDHFMYSDNISEKGFKSSNITEIFEEFEKLKKLNNAYRESTNPLSKEVIEKLKNVADEPVKDILNLLENDTEDIFRTLIKKDHKNIKNPELASMVQSFTKDPEAVLRRLQITSNNAPIMPTTSVTKIDGMLQKELVKEAFLTHEHINKGTADSNLNSIAQFLDKASLNGKQMQDTQHLASWAIFQEKAQVFGSPDYDISHIEKIAHSIEGAEMLFKSSTTDEANSTSFEMLKRIRENTKAVFEDTYTSFQKGDIFDVDDIDKGADYGEYTLLKKAITPLQAINDETKRKGLIGQFTASRDNPEHFTSASLWSLFSLNRLTAPLSAIGLDFSDTNTRSAMDIATNIMLKRVAPIALGITGLSYLNYESENLTGTSLKGAAANSLANTDLALRGIADNVGLGGFLETSRKINPMQQYIFGDEYQTKEERQEWYQEGYTPVRKGRYWAFGSSSEFRGGKVDYFQPNFLKRAHSNYYDIGVYGSSEEKWKHSLIPTLRHPLSPLRYLANPYWLEEKNYYDRPYPMTGKMFGEGAPWSAVGNATLGELIKPQKRMHEEHLDRNMVDVRLLIENRNKEIQQKANDAQVIELDNQGRFTPSTYHAMRPIGSKSVNIRLRNGEMSSHITDYEGVPGLDLNAYTEAYENIQGNSLDNAENYSIDGKSLGISGGSGSAVKGSGSKVGQLSFMSKIQMSAAKGNVIAENINKTINSSMAIANINRENRAIIKNASAVNNGVITADAIFKTKAKYGQDLIHHPETLSDLRNTTSNEEMLRDVRYSASQLGGMYGFLAREIFPEEKITVLESADNMSGFGRKFWDASVGGSGGEFMEIARRFFPHENHSIDKFNPIRNNMPNFMPSRFLTGNPFNKVSKGEMRLPGAGYEDINELHADSFGSYGAFDRMKILADVAPWSTEYKVWRDIASKTVRDPELREEMGNIRKRVIEQSKKHDFYPYKFLGEKLDYKEGVIDEVTSSNSFTLVGDEKIYKLAGIASIDKEQGGIEQHLHSGVSIRVGTDSKEQDMPSLSAVVYKDGENLNRNLLKSRVATEREDDTIAGAHASLTNFQIQRGRLYEGIAHAKIPFIHNKFMRVNSPLESYKNEQVYGTSYSTWQRPIEGFIKPPFREAFSIGPVHQTIGLAAMGLSNHLAKNTDMSAGVKMGANVLAGITNPGALAGGTIGSLLKLEVASNWTRKFATVGAAVGLAGYTAANIEDPIKSTYNFAMLGAMAGHQLFGNSVPGAAVKGLAMGAIAGLAISGQATSFLDKDRNSKYVPDNTEKRWEIEEYYDRLEYIKYTGLYEKAARKAKRKEGVDIKRVVNMMERDKKRREKIRENLLDNQEYLRNTYNDTNGDKESLLNEIDINLAMISQPTAVIKGGEYTKSALAYKQAAESTIYGLREDATWSQLLRALPTNERDYMLEFSKEKDKKKQKEILEIVSPYQRKVLDIAWGNNKEKLESNHSYFQKHKMPGAFWSGWDPSISLDNVKIKTIENEGMLLSDFGVYESQLEDPEYRSSPEIMDYQNPTSIIPMIKNLTGSLRGIGLTGVDVSVTPSNKPGIQMIANIARMTSYEVKNKLSNSLGIPFYQ